MNFEEDIENMIKEDFVRSYGWIQSTGYKVDINELDINGNHDYVFFPELEDFCHKATYWIEIEGEGIEEDIDEVIEIIEDYAEDSTLFDKFKHNEFKKAHEHCEARWKKYEEELKEK